MATDPTPEQPTSPQAPTPQAPFAWGQMAILTIILVAIAGGIYGYFVYEGNSVKVADNSGMLKSFIIQFKKDTTLKSGLTDTNQDDVADAPTDATKLLDPKELTFISIGGEDPVKGAATWKPFLEALSKKTGKPVKFLVEYPWPRFGPGGVQLPPQLGPVGNYEEQNELFSTGKLHICAYSTGQVPIAVNSLGFVPLACPADDKGEFGYEMEIIVPAESTAKTPADLKGSELMLTSLSSNAGGRVPLVVMKEEFGLMQGRDFGFRISGDYMRSILSVCYGNSTSTLYRSAKDDEERKEALNIKDKGAKTPFAAVASDILQRYVSEGLVKADQYRSIYKSKKFPPLCFGVRNDLDPKLKAAIEETFKEFSIKGSPLESRFPGKVKFAKVDYKKDWSYVREMDDKLTKLLDK